MSPKNMKEERSDVALNLKEQWKEGSSSVISPKNMKERSYVAKAMKALILQPCKNVSTSQIQHEYEVSQEHNFLVYEPSSLLTNLNVQLCMEDQNTVYVPSNVSLSLSLYIYIYIFGWKVRLLLGVCWIIVFIFIKIYDKYFRIFVTKILNINVLYTYYTCTVIFSLFVFFY